MAPQRWYVLTDLGQEGPFLAADLERLARSGALRPDDPVRAEDGGDWRPAKTLESLSGQWPAQPCCPFCGASLVADDGSAAQIRSCPACDKLVEMPAPDEAKAIEVASKDITAESVDAKSTEEVPSAYRRYLRSLPRRITLAAGQSLLWGGVYLCFYPLRDGATPRFWPREADLETIGAIMTWGPDSVMLLLAGLFVFPWGISFVMSVFLSPVFTLIQPQRPWRYNLMLSIAEAAFLRGLYTSAMCIWFAPQVLERQFRLFGGYNTFMAGVALVIYCGCFLFFLLMYVQCLCLEFCVTGPQALAELNDLDKDVEKSLARRSRRGR